MRIRDELDDIWSALNGNNIIECVDVPESDLSIADIVYRAKGISLDEFKVEAVTNYIDTHKKEK